MFEFEKVKYLHILDIPKLTIDKKMTAIMGGSGSGKTTLLKLLNKLISPSEGTIYYNGKDLNDINSLDHRKEVIMLSQNSIIFDGDLKDNLTYPYRYRKTSPPSDDRLKEVLETLNINMSLDSSLDNISGGEMQRIALARVFLSDACVLLLDEPTSALDSENSSIVNNCLRKHCLENNREIISITHSREEADKYYDQTIIVEKGKIKEIIDNE